MSGDTIDFHGHRLRAVFMDGLPWIPINELAAPFGYDSLKTFGAHVRRRLDDIGPENWTMLTVEGLSFDLQLRVKKVAA